MNLFKKLSQRMQNHSVKGVKAIGWLFIAFYLALILPCGYLVWTAYDQLKWESFHQTRQNALVLSQTISRPVVDWIERESERSILDYFYQSEQGQSAIAQQPLPRADNSLVGYFQIDSSGQFSTPWLPQNLSNQVENIANLQLKQALHIKLFDLVNQIQSTSAPSRQVNKLSQDPRSLSIKTSNSTALAEQSKPTAPAASIAGDFNDFSPSKEREQPKLNEQSINKRDNESADAAESALSEQESLADAAINVENIASQLAVDSNRAPIKNQQVTTTTSRPNLYESFQQAAPAEQEIAQTNLGQVQQLKQEQSYIERSKQAAQRVSSSKMKANEEKKRAMNNQLAAKAKKQKQEDSQNAALLKQQAEQFSRAAKPEATSQAKTERVETLEEGSGQELDELTADTTSRTYSLEGKSAEGVSAKGGSAEKKSANDSATKDNDVYLPHSTAPQQRQSQAHSDKIESLALQKNRIAAFNTQHTPLEIQFLSDTHLAFFRKVTYQGNDYIQGFIVNTQRFFEQYFGHYYYQDSLSEHGDLLIAYNNNVIKAFTQQMGLYAGEESASNRSSLDYRSRSEYALPEATLLSEYGLNGILKDFSLVYTIRALPPLAASSSILSIGGFLILMLTMSCWLMYAFTVKKIKLSLQQQNFVAAVSHELKTPLTSIRMYGEMLQQGWADQEKRQSYYQYIVDESERLSRLINNVLQLAKLSNKNLELNLKPIKATEIIDLLKSRIAQQVKAADIDLEINVASECQQISVNADSDALLQVLINLIDNSIKFCHPEDLKRIVISISKTDKRLIISVRDFGPGIEKSQLNKVANLFYRAEDEMTRKTVGTGIGLSLVKQLVEAMEGSLKLENAQPGLSAQVSLPVYAPSFSSGSVSD
jgi:signal transduction histidine kinase